MSTATLNDVGAPALMVRIYDHDRLLAREFCESEEDATEVVERWSGFANLFVVADDISTSHDPVDVPAPEEDCPIASRPQPGCGTG